VILLTSQIRRGGPLALSPPLFTKHQAQTSGFRHQVPSTRNQERLLPLNSQLSTLNPQPSTLNSQLSTLNSQPSTLNSQPSTLNPQLSTLNPQLSTLNSQLSTLNSQPSTLNPPPYLSALPSFCHLLSLGIALRASVNSWDSGSTMRSTLNFQPTTILRLCENDHQVFSPGTPSTDRRFSSNRSVVASVLHVH
jgi:uncharacterized phage infection (PIP) family protein YhgE